LWIGACGRSTGAKKKKVEPNAGATQVEQRSVGWQSSTTPDPPSDLERDKLERARATAAKDIGIPPELAGRTKPKAPSVLDIYVDGKPRSSLVASRFDAPMPLSQALGTLPIRNVLVHAPEHNAWIAASDISSFTLRRNRRGMIKLELPEGAVRGKGDGKGRATRKPDDGAMPAGPAVSRREVRAKEVRDVQWIEIRTRDSVRLEHEPE
jgi:hypothetical protein